MTIRSVGILLHHGRRDSEQTNYRLWALVANWKARGLRVDLLYGVGRPCEAELLVPHVDLSYLPHDYWAFIQSHPRVVNRRVRDIRKTAFSTLRVGRDDPWPGPVIVKTAGNCGGFADDWFATGRRTLASRVRTRLARYPVLERRSLRWARSLGRYHVFESLRAVPGGAFRNPHLIVERFIPERCQEGYVIRMHTVFGDRWLGRLLVGPDPLVKDRNSRLIESPGPPPPEIRQWRDRLGLDYGKLDYVVHEGRPVLLDVNTTPTVTGNVHAEHHTRAAADLADGLAFFEARSST